MQTGIIFTKPEAEWKRVFLVPPFAALAALGVCSENCYSYHSVAWRIKTDGVDQETAMAGIVHVHGTHRIAVHCAD